MVLDLPFVRRVKNLGAPWIVTSDENGDDVLLVDEGGQMPAPLVSLIAKLVEQRRILWQFRCALEPWKGPVVPQAREEVQPN